MPSSSSNVVETVSIDFEDFNESFLTCATCLCPFDSYGRKAKLLVCSHTVCSACLGAIAEMPPCAEEALIRCPICRETVPLPQGGIGALPPSFMVNQLMDLMNNRKRDVIPKCSVHSNEELLFCETCDKVFCPCCCDSNECQNHTVVPFSIAIKRMSEIMLYKANQCVKTLNRAAVNVQRELGTLESSVQRVLVDLDDAFAELNKTVERRRNELLQAVNRLKASKHQVLQDQLCIIESEKMKIERECVDFQKELNVRNITSHIGALNEKLDSSLSLVEPRENSFIRFEREVGLCSATADSIELAIGNFGSVAFSKTFPLLCVAVPSPAVVNLRCCVKLKTVDYDGRNRSTGGDPVWASVAPASGALDSGSSLVANGCSTHSGDVQVVDNENGTYDLYYTPRTIGRHSMTITIFGRVISNSPLTIDVSPHNNPVWQYDGSVKQDAAGSLLQPVRVASIGRKLYVLDSGHCVVKVINADGTFARQIQGLALGGQSAVGLAVKPGGTGIFTLNWRSKLVTEWTLKGEELKKFTFSEFLEPIDLAIDSNERVVVVDNGRAKVFVFDKEARPLFSFPLHKVHSAYGQPAAVGGRAVTGCSATPCFTCVAVGVDDDILVGGSDVQLYSSAGQFLRAFSLLPLHLSAGAQPAVVGSLAVDTKSLLVLATITSRKASFVAVYAYDGTMVNQIDSFQSKLRRPSGICIAEDCFCLVADLLNNCIKKYRYK